MEKTKIKQDIRDNGEKKKLSRVEIVKLYHQKTGYLAGLKEID